MKQKANRSAVSAAERLEVVGELASLINLTFDLSEIFRAAIVKLQRVIEFRRASVVLVSDDRAHYYLHTLYDAVRGGFIEKKETFPLDSGLPGQVIRTGEAIRVDEFGGTESIRTDDEEKVSALIVPLHLDGEVIGTLNLGAKQSMVYQDEDLEFTVILARQIETSLHYSKLLATIQRQQKTLASELSRLKALIDASDAAILMVSDGRVAHVNRAMVELLGIPAEVVMGAPMEQINRALVRFLGDPGALTAQTAALESADTPLRDRVEFAFPRKRVCQRTVAAVFDPQGEMLGHLILYRDITREAEEAKSEFVSIVSHELRTPLTSVKTSISVLMKGAAGKITEPMRELCEIALRNLDRLVRLVDDLLDLSRIQSDPASIELVPVSVKKAADGAVDAVRGFAQERQVRLECGVSDDATFVMADPDRLEQVIINLLSNAIKFSPPQACVALRWWNEREATVLEVCDEGPGIPSDQLDTIFEKFKQLETSAARRQGGVGLGLAISHTLVEHFGGDLWAESEEGCGSRFFVRLKLAK